MFWAIMLVLLALWFVGLLAGFTLGGFIHVLLLLIVAMILVRAARGGR